MKKRSALNRLLAPLVFSTSRVNPLNACISVNGSLDGCGPAPGFYVSQAWWFARLLAIPTCFIGAFLVLRMAIAPEKAESELNFDPWAFLARKPHWISREGLYAISVGLALLGIIFLLFLGHLPVITQID